MGNRPVFSFTDCPKITEEALRLERQNATSLPTHSSHSSFPGARRICRDFGLPITEEDKHKCPFSAPMYQYAAETSDKPIVLNNLAFCYRNAIDSTDRNQSKAWELYREAARRGFAPAMTNLASLEQDEKVSLCFLFSAAHLGDQHALKLLQARCPVFPHIQSRKKNVLSSGTLREKSCPGFEPGSRD